MLGAWNDTYESIVEAIRAVKYGPAYFRGHADASWRLLPALARVKPTGSCNQRFESELAREQGASRYFRQHAGDLLPQNVDAWTLAYAMQHYGLPTRLLDWTTTFSIALYFALNRATPAAAIWILDPFALNSTTAGSDTLFGESSLRGDYDDYFIDRTKELEGRAIALAPLRHNPRIFSQRGAFTLHDDLEASLDEIAPLSLRKIVIPPDAQQGARLFLQLSGISEFTLFPELDGLARELRRLFFE